MELGPSKSHFVCLGRAIATYDRGAGSLVLNKNRTSAIVCHSGQSTGRDRRCGQFGEYGRLLLTVEAAAELLSLGRTAVYDLVATGELTSVKIGRSRRVPYDALRLFVERRSNDLGSAPSVLASDEQRAA